MIFERNKRFGIIVVLALLLLVGFVLAEEVLVNPLPTGLAETASFNDGQPVPLPVDSNSNQPNSIGVTDQSAFNPRNSGDFNAERETLVGSSVNPQFNRPGSGSQYFSPGMAWSDYGSEYCMPQQDLVLMIPPGGCKPAVVRSDLLEEQNVPVFCKISALQVNPLIGINRIRSMTFPKRETSEGVSGVSYYPARSAIGGKRDVGTQIYNDNMGYLVVTLNRQQNEDSMPDYVEGNITAVIDYQSEGVFGVGDSRFYLTETSDREWARDYKDYSFWNGKGYVRVELIEDNKATVSIYRDFDTKEGTVTIREGETSTPVYLSGFYCGAGLSVKAEKIGYPVDSALLQINDEQIWVSKGDKIMDEKCRVLKLDLDKGGGDVEISCPGSERVKLSLGSGKAVFDTNRAVSLGENVAQNVYLAYIGQDSLNIKYVILIKDEFSSTINEFKDKDTYKIIENAINISERIIDQKDKIEKKLREHYKTKLGLKSDEVNSKVNIEIIEEGKDGFGVVLSDLQIIKDRNWDYGELSEHQKLSKEYYDQAVEEYDELIELYPYEEMEYVEEDPYGAKALLNLAQLSKHLGMDQKAHEYYQQLLQEYPDSDAAVTAQNTERLLLKYDTTNSKASVKVANAHYFIDLLDVKKPSSDEASATLLINGREEVLGVGRVKVVEKDGYTHRFKLKDIGDDYVDIEYEKSGKDLKKNILKKKRIRMDDSDGEVFSNVPVRLIDIKLKKQVKLSLVAQGYGPRAQSDLKFKIGIEKRAIKINPEKAKEMMEGLQESIKTWNDINKKLGNVISGLKAACFATSTVLNIKSMLDGMSGKSMARGALMKNAGGWNDKCEELIGNREYDTLQQCLLDKSSDVEKDIDIYSQQLDETNNIMKGIQDKIGKDHTDIFDFQGQVDSSKVSEEFKGTFDSWCQGQSDSITLPDRSNSQVNFGSGDGSICSWDTMSHEQRRDIMTWRNTQSAGGSEVLRNVSNANLGKVLLNAKNYHDSEGARKKAEDESSKYNLGVRTTSAEGDNVAQGFIKSISITDSGHNIYGHYDDGESIVRVYIPPEKNLGGGETFRPEGSVSSEISGKQVIVEVEYSDDGHYIPKSDGKVFSADGARLSEPASNEVRRYMSLVGLDKIKHSDKKAYQNRMKNTDRLRVKFFERAPYKGLPSEVPFDVENGWYAEMTHVLSGFGQPYEESGRVINYYICNVGENGLIEFKQSGDDICRYYNSYSGAEINFPGMNSEESKRLVVKAEQSINDAAKQYGKDRITINGQGFKSGVSFGGEAGQCTDFMSATDCSLMFNVCDPVICPASRCDFGGKYRVDNVIQSGIVGSLLLCLPNFKEGVMVPICLSGVHAGIEGYLSILNSTAECLNESIETGREIGICDEIKSIYLCDFFWRQAAPLMKVLLPQMLQGMYGQGARGGGEYLTVQTAWDNMQNSANYFTQNYAVNSVKAFSSRSVEYAWETSGEEVGAEVCKGFISANFGSANNMFKALIEPDSPEQYHSWFSETPMTTATVPAQSHYKVYYHIFSGNDMGAQYMVYLKDLPTTGSVTGSVHSTGYFTVDRGYVRRGGQVDQTKDFIAPSGFKQLCININGRDECGFGKVSTSYALNALTESFVADQAKQDIKSEKQCVAGTPSVGSLLQPNLQAGVEEVLNPQLYNEGIIRICSSENPGKQVSTNGEYDRTGSTSDRWKEVGYCDDQKIRCWLDTETVKDVIVDKGLEQEILDEADRSIIDQSGFWTYEQSRSVADTMNDFIDDFEVEDDDTKDSINKRIKMVVADLVDLTKFGIDNVHRARGQYMLGKLFGKISEELWKDKGSDSAVTQFGDLDYEEDPFIEFGDGDEEVEFDELDGVGDGTEEGYGTRVFDSLNYIVKFDESESKLTDYYITRKDDGGYDIYEKDGGFAWFDKDVGRMPLTRIVYEDVDTGTSFDVLDVVITLERKDFTDVLVDLDKLLYYEEKERFVYINDESDESEDPFFQDDGWTDDMLEIDRVIKIKNPSDPKFSIYNYRGTKWTTNEDSFDEDYSYVEGVSIIIDQLELEGILYIRKSGTDRLIERGASETYGEFLERIFEILKKE
jgi:tetratricopeptide (TPR) repeat protein